jgi:hypothetical protein
MNAKRRILTSAVAVACIVAMASSASATSVFGLSLFNDPNDAGVGTVSVHATPSYLYIQWQVLDSTDARLGDNTFGSDQTSVNIGPSNAQWGHPYDIVFQTGADSQAWGGTSSGTIDGWQTQWEVNGIQQPVLPAGLQSNTVYDGTYRFTDWVIPLGSLGLTPGDTLVLGGSIEMGNEQGNPTYVWPVGLDFNFAEPHDGGTFAQVTVVPLPAAAWAGLMLLGGMGGVKAFRRRREQA